MTFSHQVLFAVSFWGDISAFPLDHDRTSPQLAYFVVRQAQNVAKNILHKDNILKFCNLCYIKDNIQEK
jgi:hypothetical protein